MPQNSDMVPFSDLPFSSLVLLQQIDPVNIISVWTFVFYRIDVIKHRRWTLQIAVIQKLFQISITG